MEEFFGFIFKVSIVFVIFWWLGLNFFRHSYDIKTWLGKRKLQKLADEHKDKVIDLRKVFKEEFGFLENPKYLQQRLQEIKKEMIEKRGNFVSLNALEFIFLIDELKTEVLKTDEGIYIVSQKDINTLFYEQEKDILYYAKKMREYSLKFLPKEGEPIVLNAEEVLYWVRTGMMKRPIDSIGNKVFRVKANMQENYMSLKDDFVTPNYSLSIVSHDDFLEFQKNRIQIDERGKPIKELESLNILKEGRMMVFSDNTRRMKLGNIVFITDRLGKIWKEDIFGNVILEEENKNKKIYKNTSSLISLKKKKNPELDEVLNNTEIDAKIDKPLFQLKKNKSSNKINNSKKRMQ